MRPGEAPRPSRRERATRTWRLLTLRSTRSVDPTARIAARRVRGWTQPRLTVTSVYRLRNAAVLQRLLEPILEEADVRLWALDAVAPELAQWTLGSGAGDRFDIHERLLEHDPTDPDATWLIVDDDVSLPWGSLLTLVTIARRAQFDVFGPAHTSDSYFSHLITLQRPFVMARESGFVEIGPVLGFSPEARRRLLPFIDPTGLGWGMEAVWAAAGENGLSLGIVDAQPVKHLGAVAAAYEQGPERERFSKLLTSSGFRTLQDLFLTQHVWRAWKREPGWAVSDDVAET